MSRVLVIVVSYNGMPWLERCLGSVLPGANEASGAPGAKKNGLPGANEASGAPGGLDVFVWDNASTDGSADYVASRFPQAHLVRSGENALFARPNNEGLRWALDHGYDYAYLLNQDAWLEDGALETLLKAASEHPEYAVLSPLQLAPDGSLDRNFKKICRPYGRHLSLRSGLRLASLAQNDKSGPEGDVFCADYCRKSLPRVTKQRSSGRRPYPGFFAQRKIVEGEKAAGVYEGAAPPVLSAKRIMAAHWLVNLEAVRRIGLFNEELFPLYGQDDDWCNRARYHGFRIGIIPEARGVHDRAQRKEPKAKLIDRNYRSASLVRLADINRPLWCSFLYVCLYTLVKAVKYASLKPIGLFPGLCKQLPALRAWRATACKSANC